MSASAPQFGKLKLIGRVSLWFAAVAFAGLVALLVLARPVSGDYLELVRSMSLTRQQLPTLMAMGALLLSIGTALTTWLITLYSSFKVAGPLHRFCLDLEQGTRDGEVPRIRLRADDEAQEDARQLEETVRRLYRHYDDIAGALESAALHVRRGGDEGGAAVPDARIRQLVDEVKL